MDIKQKYEVLKRKVADLDFKKMIGTKAFLTVGCVMLICVAVFVSSLVNRNSEQIAGEEGNRVLGNTLLVDASASDENASNQKGETPDKNTGASQLEDDFFAMSIINRTQVRDSALEVLNEIAANPDTLPDAKEDALSSIAAIADEMTAEANIETLIKAKGIAECVAVISGEKCSIVVNASGLEDDALTQITDIVFEQTGIEVQNITVVEAKK